MTTLNQIAENIKNETLRYFFVRTYKQLVNHATKNGFDFKEANRLAFDALIKNRGLDKIALELAKPVMTIA